MVTRKQRREWIATAVSKLTELQIAYLAGLFEGEAYFGFLTSTKGVRCTMIRLKMTDLDIMTKVAAMLGAEAKGPMRDRGFKDHYKSYWTIRLNGHSSAHFLRLIYPYMGERRRARIDEILEVLGCRRHASALVSLNGRSDEGGAEG